MNRNFAISVVAAGVVAYAGCGGDEGSIEAFCDQVEEARAAPDAFESIRNEDVEGAKAALEDAEQQLADLAEVAPEEIRGDVEEFQGLFEGLVAEVQDTETTQELFRAALDYQEEAENFQETSASLQEFTDENCGAAPAGEAGEEQPEAE